MDIMASLGTLFRKQSREGRDKLNTLARDMAAGKKSPDVDVLNTALVAGGKTFAEFEKMVEAIREVRQLESEVAGIDMAVEVCGHMSQALLDHQAETVRIAKERHRESMKLLAAKNDADRAASDLKKAAARLSSLKAEHYALLGEQPLNLDGFKLIAHGPCGGTVISIADESAPVLFVDIATLNIEQSKRATLLQRAFAKAKAEYESATNAWTQRVNKLNAAGDWREAKKLPAPELTNPTWRELASQTN